MSPATDTDTDTDTPYRLHSINQTRQRGRESPTVVQNPPGSRNQLIRSNDNACKAEIKQLFIVHLMSPGGNFQDQISAHPLSSAVTTTTTTTPTATTIEANLTKHIEPLFVVLLAKSIPHLKLILFNYYLLANHGYLFCYVYTYVNVGVSVSVCMCYFITQILLKLLHISP